MGQLHMNELPPGDVCPECRAKAPNGKVRILGSRGIVEVDAQMWCTGTGVEGNLFHATLHIGHNAVILCTLQDDLDGSWPRY